MVKATNLDQLKKLAQRAQARTAALNAQLSGIKIPEFSLVKQEAAEDGYLATYYLTKDGGQVGEKINIPKDIFVQSAVLETVCHTNVPYSGAVVKDKYIDFTLASEDGSFLGVTKVLSVKPTLKRLTVNNIPIADMMPGFSMKVNNIRATVKVQETLEAEDVIWNDEAKTDCTLCVTANEMFSTSTTKGSLGYMFNMLFSSVGMAGNPVPHVSEMSEDNTKAYIQIVTRNSEAYPPDIFIGDAEHLFIPVSDLVDIYTGGNGVTVTSASKVNAVVDAANANGLSVTASGLQLALASETSIGAMSAEDKAKLDSTVLATDAEVDAMLDGVFGSATQDTEAQPGEETGGGIPTNPVGV